MFFKLPEQDDGVVKMVVLVVMVILSKEVNLLGNILLIGGSLIELPQR